MPKPRHSWTRSARRTPNSSRMPRSCSSSKPTRWRNRRRRPRLRSRRLPAAEFHNETVAGSRRYARVPKSRALYRIVAGVTLILLSGALAMKRLFLLALATGILAAAEARAANPVVVVDTSLGSFKVELFKDEAPVTVK